LISWLEKDRIRLNDIITHRLPLAEAPHGYEIFNEKKENCVKIVLSP
jgi:S-(hydroxymethyl)glutathione dehydrogenase/alcohol dehydrogenase